MGRRAQKRERRERLQFSRRMFERQRRSNLLAEPGVHECVLILDQLKPDFNIGKIFRTADAMGVREIHLIGLRYFDPSPAMGSFKWVPARFFEDFEQSSSALLADGYSFFALEPDAPEFLTEAELPSKSAFILGHEEFGIRSDTSTCPAIRTLSLPQFGKVQSLNVSIAASLAMYEYTRQWGKVEQTTNYTAIPKAFRGR